MNSKKESGNSGEHVEFLEIIIKAFCLQSALIREFRNQDISGNISKISVNHTCYRQIGSKSTITAYLHDAKKDLDLDIRPICR